MATIYGFPQDGYPYSAAEVGAVFAALISRHADGTPREGVLREGPLISGVTGAWQVRVEPFAHVSADGARAIISGIDEAVFVEVLPAPGTGSRIDLICWVPLAAEVAVVEGTPAASPVAPELPGGMSVLGSLRVTAGQINAAQGAVAQLFQHSSIAGQPTPVRTLDELAAFPAVDGAKAYCFEDKCVHIRRGGVWLGGHYTLTPQAPFRHYGDSAPFGLLVSNGVVRTVGAASTSSPGALSGNDAGVMATIPAALRPSHSVFAVSQGSSNARWLATIHPNGQINAGRYGPGAAVSNVWLPANAQWLI